MTYLNPSNILIIKPGAIGDLLQITPVIRALHGKYPGARISIMVGSAATASLFRHNPLVHEAIVFDKRGEQRSIKALAGLWRRLRRERYDLVLNFQRSNLKGWFLASAAFPCRLLVYHKARRHGVHAVANHLETLAPLGIDLAAADHRLEIYPGTEAKRFACELFARENLNGATVIALNPGASHPVNRWGTKQFALLADSLSERLQARVIIVGGREDAGLAEDIAAICASRPLLLTGRTDLLQLAAVLGRCALLVTGDTGPMHIATAVGTRVLALFGAADPARTGPVGSGHRVIQAASVACVPCRSRRCANSRYLECMERITAEEAHAVVIGMLREGEEA
jgi:lipopolysaccharide heptosyltransferase II